MSDMKRTITPNDPADFTPTREPQIPLRPFRYWCQKVLPLVYDDSISYYELLCKIVDYLNKTMEDVENMDIDISNLLNTYNQLQDYVNNYFSTLDVQEEINNKLDEMAQNGTLLSLFTEYSSFVMPEWYGAIGDGVIDDSNAIQNAIYSGKQVIFGHEKTYKVTKTLIIPVGTYIDFSYSHITPAGNAFTNNYVFSLNSSNADTWDEQFSTDIITLKNLVSVNSEYESQSTRLSLFYICGMFDIENVTSRYYNYTILVGSYYLDFKRLYNISVIDAFSNYAIYVRGQGDGVDFNNIHFIKYLSNSLLSGLRLVNSMGGFIRGLINGSSSFENVSSLTISNAHIERGNITIVNSSLSINDSLFYYNTDAEGSSLTINNGNFTSNHVVALNNVMFGIYETLSNHQVTTDYNDIDSHSNLSTIVLNYVRRLYYPYSMPANYNQQSGISVLTRKGVLNPPFKSVINSGVVPHYSCYPTQPDPSNLITGASLSSVKSTENIGFDGLTGNYSYQGAILLNKNKNILFCSNHTENVNVNDTSNMVQINVGITNIPILRLYRYYNNTVTHYVDIPFPSTILYDNGVNVCGYVWKTMTGSVQTTTGSIISYEEFNSNVNTYSHLICTAEPQGSFSKGDTWKYNVPTSGEYLHVYNDGWSAV